MPVMAPERKAMARPAARLWLDACAVRTLARTETIMPAKPAMPERTAPMRKPMATVSESSHGDDDEDDDADDGDGHVLAAEVGGGAFLDRRGDLLHARRPCIGGEHVARRPRGVGDGKQAAENDEIEHGLSPSVRRSSRREKRPNRPEFL